MQWSTEERRRQSRAPLAHRAVDAQGSIAGAGFGESVPGASDTYSFWRPPPHRGTGRRADTQEPRCPLQFHRRFRGARGATRRPPCGSHRPGRGLLSCAHSTLRELRTNSRLPPCPFPAIKAKTSKVWVRQHTEGGRGTGGEVIQRQPYIAIIRIREEEQEEQEQEQEENSKQM